MPKTHCLLIATFLFCHGCLLSHEQKRVIRETEPLRQVQFESDVAAEQFNRIATSESKRKSLGSSASFGIPFIIGLSRKTMPSQNAYYNDQVARCDVNSDDLITEQEAFSFAGE